MDEHAWPWLICSELQLTLSLSLTFENTPFLCKGDRVVSFQQENHSLSPSLFPDHQTHLALLQTISPGNSGSAIVGRQSKSLGRQSPVFGSTALCTTSRGTNRRHRLLGNFSPPAGLQLQTATDPWTRFDYMQPSVSSAKILLHPVCQLWICVVDEEKWYRELTPMLTTPKSQWSFIQKMSFQPSHLQPCGLQRHLAFVLHCHANAKWNEYKKVIFCYLCWILFSHLGVNSLQHIWNKAKKVTLTYQVFFHLWNWSETTQKDRHKLLGAAENLNLPCRLQLYWSGSINVARGDAAVSGSLYLARKAVFSEKHVNCQSGNVI